MTPTTKLEAVNIMLSSIGEAPVNSLDSGLVDAEMAETILNATSREVQSRGWKFNTEKNFEILPTPDGEILLPLNCLRADAMKKSDDMDLIQRGNKMYNLISHSFKINTTVSLELVLNLDFELLPEAARHYITIKAGRVFQDRLVSSNDLHGFQEKDEMFALVELKDSEGEIGDYSIFDNYAVTRVLNRSMGSSLL